MQAVKVLLNTYYELLYEQLQAGRERCAGRMKELLAEEIARRGYKKLNETKQEAYLDACVAFVTERLESYNPIGMQYTFPQTSRSEAFELEQILDWYDSRAEFEALCQAARAKVKGAGPGADWRGLAGELIAQCGAYPDRSIIRDYEAAPALQKLPDYVVSRAIEELVGAKGP